MDEKGTHSKQNTHTHTNVQNLNLLLPQTGTFSG